MPFHVHILQKAKFAPFTKMPFSENGKNVHGNVIHIVNLLTLIENKKL